MLGRGVIVLADIDLIKVQLELNGIKRSFLGARRHVGQSEFVFVSGLWQAIVSDGDASQDGV